MSLSINLLDDLVRPSRLLDQHHHHLGMDLNDYFIIPRSLCTPYYRTWRNQSSKNDCGSTITRDNDKFQINLDVQQFSPEEISVKVNGNNTITIEGKHEEKEDEHGFVSRHFVRRYILPDGHDINKVASNLSSDGVLSVTASRLEGEENEGERNVPITQTGAPTVAIKDKKN